jgi:hypothetical protein
MFKMVDDDMLMGLVPILIAAVYWFLVSEGLGLTVTAMVMVIVASRNAVVAQQRLQWQELRRGTFKRILLVVSVTKQ